MKHVWKELGMVTVQRTLKNFKIRSQMVLFSCICTLIFN